MVVKMRGFQTDVQPVPQQIHGEQERHGIRPAGDGADDRIPGMIISYCRIIRKSLFRMFPLPVGKGWYWPIHCIFTAPVSP